MAQTPKNVIIQQLSVQLANDKQWQHYLNKFTGDIHLAILQEPYLTYILQGTKTVESRFAKVKYAPFNQVAIGDILVLKQSGGSIKAICKATAVWFYELTPTTLNAIKRKFEKNIQPEEPNSFWKTRTKCKVATLIKISDVTTIPHLEIKKKDRRGWVRYH